MTQIALHHVDRGACVQQRRGLGVTKPMAVRVEQRAAGCIPESDHLAEPAEHQVIVAGLPGPGALAVPGQPGKQIPHRSGRPELPAFSHPGLLFPDDLDDVGADQDGDRCAFDFGLLVAQPGNHPAFGDGGRVDAGDVGERLEVHQQNLGGASPGEGLD